MSVNRFDICTFVIVFKIVLFQIQIRLCKSNAQRSSGTKLLLQYCKHNYKAYVFTIFNMYYISTRTDLNQYALKRHMISRHTYLSTTVIAPHFGVKQTVPSAECRPTLRRLNLNEGYLSYIYKPRVYPSTRCFIRANSC